MESENMMCLLLLQGDEVSVTLEEDALNWAYSKKKSWRQKSPWVSVPVNEIVTVQQGDHKQQTKAINAPSTYFTVYYVLRKSCMRWSLQLVTFTAPDAQVAHEWVQHIQEKVQQKGPTRPRKLLVFINPYGGCGKASRIYYTKISHLFQLAEIESEVIETIRANHARDFIMAADLQKYDGVVCVGGDGMFSELLHGLVSRTQSDNGICEDKEDAKLIPCSLRIGIIPAGSTDCVCFATMGINDPVTSALHIIIGLRMVLSNRSYRGTVEFLEAKGDSSPRDNTRCRTGCLVCSESSERLAGTSENNVSNLENWKSVTGSFVALNITGMSSACPKSHDGLSPTAHLADGTADLIMVQKCSTLQFLKHLSRHTNSKDQFALPNVKVHRIHAMRFTPEQLEDEETVRRQKRLFVCPCGEETVTSTWNCDGEILDCAQLSIRVHHQLIQIFARGIENMPSR
ncbi:ceramide kinase-like isoform X3 [Pyxicephalus adspersus]|uniref:ceramide kinase-like isoform X3 n=1 Tax=Pyxicephalus adspersus TaxID=30357 RepID=UPI003B593056